MRTATLLSTEEVCEITGLTYRQLDYYTRHGVVAPAVEARGSGTRRGWLDEQVPQIMVVASVANAMREISGIERAGNLALYRRIAGVWRDGVLKLGPGVAIAWEVPTWPSI